MRRLLPYLFKRQQSQHDYKQGEPKVKHFGREPKS